MTNDKMKIIQFKRLVFLLMASLVTFSSYSQRVGINSTGALPNASALLDVDAAPGNNMGILIPRVALSAINSNAPIGGAVATSLLVYNTATAGVAPNNVVPGYYYWDGTKWVQLVTGNGNGNAAWLLLGNAGTVDGVNFLGTTDNVPMNFRVNNQKAGRIDLTGPTFLGYQAGNINTATDITGMGYQALFANTSGIGNTAHGVETLRNNTIGNDNTATGWRALYTNTIGEDNTAYGVSALYNTTIGDGNTASGQSALYNNTIGNYNTAYGMQSLFSNTTGYSNVAIGIGSLQNSINRSNLVAVGDSALYNNGMGVIGGNEATANTAVGSKALYHNNRGFSNTAVGYHALDSNTTGPYNTATGAWALVSNTSGISNTANGTWALYSNTTGAYNVANGVQALYSNITGNANTAMGFHALRWNTDGEYNTAIGQNALWNNTTGNENTGTGQWALRRNTSSSRNIAIGSYALYNYGAISGYTNGGVAWNSNNVAVGYEALYSNWTYAATEGISNTAVGNYSLRSNTMGSYNTALGYNAFNTGATYSNSTAIGANAVITASNNMVLGDGNVVGWGFGVAPGANAITVGTGVTNGNGANLTLGGVWTNGSSITFKDNITHLDEKEILDKIMKLNVARWRYKGTNEYHIGPFAEQFYELFNTGIDSRYISTIDPSGVALAAIKAQQKIIISLQTENKNLKAENSLILSEIKTLKSDYESRLKKLEEIYGTKAEK